MSEIQEIQEIEETQEIQEIDDTEEEIPKKKAGRPKGSKNVAKAIVTKNVKKIEPPPEPPVKKSKIVKESTRPPVKHVRKSRTRVIVLSSSDESDHKIRVVRKPAKPSKKYEYCSESSDSDAPAPAPAPKPLVEPVPQLSTKTLQNPANRFAFDIQADHQLRSAATKRTYDSFFSHLR